jgi:hypothetical protein
MASFADRNGDREAGAGADEARSTDASAERNRIVGPLTDDELRTGGMDRITAYARNPQSKEAVRKEKQRKRQRETGKRQINIVLPDTERSRATIRAAASAIEEEVTHQAFEALLRDEGLSSLVATVAGQPALRNIIELSGRLECAGVLDAVKLVIERSDIAALLTRVSASAETYDLVESAVAHPQFVALGQQLATGEDFCTRAARLLLRVCRRQSANPG